MKIKFVLSVITILMTKSILLINGCQTKQKKFYIFFIKHVLIIEFFTKTQ